MSQSQRPRSIIDSLGEEIVRIITPVTICMLLVVILVSLLNSDSDAVISSIATVAYTESSTDSDWDKFTGAILNSLVFVAVVTIATFFMVLLFYFRCTKFLKFYMGFSSLLVLGSMGGEIALILISKFGVSIDAVTFMLVLFNFSVVGALAVFMPKMAIFVTQTYLVVIGALVAYWFTMLPEWTTWALLIAMALYDLAAVLLPVGPLKLLVELAISRDEDIPALVYEARPVINGDIGTQTSRGTQSRIWNDRLPEVNGSSENMDTSTNGLCDPGSVHNLGTDTRLVLDTELSRPLIDTETTIPSSRSDISAPYENLMLEGVGLGTTGAIKLGLGDFIFYSVLVGRAAMYDFMTVYACYLAIMAGLGVTLMLLAVYRKALPALPVSIALGVLFYFLARLLLEAFLVQCSLNLLMF